MFAIPPSSKSTETELILTSRYHASLDITYPDLTTEQIVIPGGGSAVSVLIDASWRVYDGVETLGFHIDSDVPIAAHMATEGFLTAVQPEASMLRPISDDSVEFFIASYHQAFQSSVEPYSFYVIIASEPDTHVLVYTKVDGNPVIEVDINLQQHQVFTRDASLEAGGHGMDFTGDYIVTDKPVAVMSGHGSAFNDDVSVLSHTKHTQYYQSLSSRDMCLYSCYLVELQICDGIYSSIGSTRH